MKLHNCQHRVSIRFDPVRVRVRFAVNPVRRLEGEAETISRCFKLP